MNVGCFRDHRATRGMVRSRVQLIAEFGKTLMPSIYSFCCKAKFEAEPNKY
jgi:hypothetical protein